ncbi:hypothetical protein C8R44DRAFT_725148 [Mycena epipterygia]|nr:hypothetical protein C8R44DRAFT_725148 [Mycena epipterygia]
MGPCLLDIAAALPRLTHLTLNSVSAIPYRKYSWGAAPLPHMHTVRISYSPLAVLGWLTLVAPHTKTLSLDGLVAHNLDYLISYVSVIGPTLELLDIAFFGTPLDELMLPLVLQLCTNLKAFRLNFDVMIDV